MPPIPLHLLLPAVAAGLCGAVCAGDNLPLPLPQPMQGAAVQAAPGVEIHYGLLQPSGGSTGPGQLEGIVSGPRGELRSSVLLNPGADRRLARLDTSLQAQAPGLLQTVVIGDTFGSGGGWSRPVRLGGVRIGRALALRPGFNATPQAAVAGSAALPSSPLPAFAARPDPALAAANALRHAVPGLHQPAQSGPAHLEAGASDYEIEAGRLRSGWGTADDQYGEGYAATAYRRGLGAQLTAEARAEWTPSRTAAGLEVSRRMGFAGSVNAVLAQSATPQESGLRWGMGWAGHADGAAWSVAWDGFERGFTPLAAGSGEADPRGGVRATASLPLGAGASAGLAYTRQANGPSPAAGVLGLSAQLALIERSSLSLNLSRRAGVDPAWQAGLKLDLPLGGRRL